MLKAAKDSVAKTAIEEIISILKANGDRVKVLTSYLYLSNNYGGETGIYCCSIEYRNNSVVLTDDMGTKYEVQKFEVEEIIDTLRILENAI